MIYEQEMLTQFGFPLFYEDNIIHTKNFGGFNKKQNVLGHYFGRDNLEATEKITKILNGNNEKIYLKNVFFEFDMSNDCIKVNNKKIIDTLTRNSIKSVLNCTEEYAKDMHYLFGNYVAKTLNNAVIGYKR